MELQDLMNKIQFCLGFVITVFAINIFVNIHNYMLATVEEQLFIIWNTLFIILILYGSFQMMNGSIAIFMTKKEEK